MIKSKEHIQEDLELIYKKACELEKSIDAVDIGDMVKTEQLLARLWAGLSDIRTLAACSLGYDEAPEDE